MTSTLPNGATIRGRRCQCQSLELHTYAYDAVGGGGRIKWGRQLTPSAIVRTGDGLVQTGEEFCVCAFDGFVRNESLFVIRKRYWLVCESLLGVISVVEAGC